MMVLGMIKTNELPAPDLALMYICLAHVILPFVLLYVACLDCRRPAHRPLRRYLRQVHLLDFCQLQERTSTRFASSSTEIFMRVSSPIPHFFHFPLPHTPNAIR